MSKSLGNIVDPVALGDLYGSDSVRLYFLSEGPQDYDANFNESDLIATYNLFIEGFSKLLNFSLLHLQITLNTESKNKANLMSRVFNKKIIKHGRIDRISWEFNKEDIDYINKFNAFREKV